MPTFTGIKFFIARSGATFLIYVLIALALVGIAYLLPKGKKATFIERIVIMSCSALVILIPLIANFDGFNAGRAFFINNLDVYLLIALVAVLLLGMFTESSYLTQGLYGALISVSLPFGLLNIVFPYWTKANTVGELFSNPKDLFFFLIFVLMFFIPVWMIRTGIYKLRLTSILHMLSGLAIGGAGIIFLWETKLLHSRAIMNAVQLFGNSELNPKLLTAFITGIALLVIVMLVISVAATLIRKYAFKSGERLFASETVEALLIRLGGRLLAIGVCGLGALLLPGWVGADLPADRLGLPGAFLFLLPVILFGVISFFTEYLAEMMEIKHAIGKAKAAELAEEALAAEAEAEEALAAGTAVEV